MPELAEVAFFCSRWSPCFGSPIQTVVLNKNSRCFREVSLGDLTVKLAGNRLVGSRTRGKRMLFQLEKEVWLGVHLGMTGSLLIRDLCGDLGKHDHLALRTSQGWLVYKDPRQFGKIEMFISPDVPEVWKDLPHEIGSRYFNYKYFEAILKRRRGTPLKSLLLLQEHFPGIGNWMADEVLWRAKIRPQRCAKSLSESEMKTLFQSLKFVCKGAIKYIASDYSDPPNTWLFRHRWKPGGTCPRTGSKLERSVVGGRTTCWSAQWQK